MIKLQITYWRQETASEITCAKISITEIPTEIYIGQDEDCFICLKDSPYVSRKHASIIVDDDDRFLIKDNYSVNGIALNRWGEISQLNGSAARLLHGDAFSIADFIFIFNVELPEKPIIKEAQEISKEVQYEAMLKQQIRSRPFRVHQKTFIEKALIRIVGAPAQRMYEAKILRMRVEDFFPTDSDLDAFLIDCFPEVKRRCSNGMERKAKINLLLELIDRQILDKAINDYHEIN